MKVHQEECAPLASHPLPPPIHSGNGLKGCPLYADVVVMLIAFAILACCVFSLSYGEAIFATGKILQKNYKFLQITGEQAGNARKEGSPQQKHNWFVFPDLSENALEEAIVKKELEVTQSKTEGQSEWEMEKQARAVFFREKSKIAELQSLKHVMVNYGGEKEAVEELNQKQELIYRLRYQIDKYTDELPFCVVVYSRDYGNEELHHQPLLHSIFNQKYSNFRVIFIADAMPPQTLLSLYKFIKKQQWGKKVQVVEVQQKQGYSRAILKALRYSCRSAEVAAFINGNDQLITQHVLSVYNAVYQSRKPKVAYGNFYQYRPTEEQIFMGSSTGYTPEELESASYREGMPKVGPLLTFNLTLARYLDESYLKYDENIFYEWEDISFKALSLQLLELSCGRVEYVFECQYLMSHNKNGLERREFIRQIHMEPRRCYQYQQARGLKE